MNRIAAPSSVRWLLTLFIALAWLPAFAGPEKTFSYQLTVPLSATNPTYLPATDGEPQFDSAYVQFTIKNESPPSVANSNIGSFQFTLVPWQIFEIAGCPSGATCTFDSTNTVYVTNISPPIQAQAQATVTLKVITCGDARIAGVPLVYNGATLSGQTFAPGGKVVSEATISCGALACGQSFLENDIAGFRGRYNNDGSCSVLNSYFVTNTLPLDGRLHFEWILTPQSREAFVYAADVTTGAPLSFSWRDDANGNPVFITATNCEPSPSSPTAALPFPYGTLITSLSRTASTLKIALASGVTVPAVPFRIVVESERMVVTAINGTSWTVQRAADGTTAATHAASAMVMSTHLPPMLPLVAPSPYSNDYYARMCIATTVNNGDNTSTIWILDGGDGWLSIQ